MHWKYLVFWVATSSILLFTWHYMTCVCSVYCVLLRLKVSVQGQCKFHIISSKEILGKRAGLSLWLHKHCLDDWPAHQRHPCTHGASGLPMAEDHCSAKLCPCHSTHAAGLAGQKRWFHRSCAMQTSFNSFNKKLAVLEWIHGLCWLFPELKNKTSD